MPVETVDTYTFTPGKRGFFSASGKKRGKNKSSKAKSKGSENNKK